jgi:hypothetical protein
MTQSVKKHWKDNGLQAETLVRAEAGRSAQAAGLTGQFLPQPAILTLSGGLA